ncbi:hypothetical protein EHP00_1162 [Ecytonucleospora hepatopenaei]|uniref:Uncharacterized protein n=1 Tax=Ecytonucleospora hepatopenaei TaxID=646526 RepID=A0A1W0E4G0_9MICR|nr:hypothetical protein EHP00_1162 [Ecytonucleospora hepatopenaei]
MFENKLSLKELQELFTMFKEEEEKLKIKHKKLLEETLTHKMNLKKTENEKKLHLNRLEDLEKLNIEIIKEKNENEKLKEHYDNEIIWIKEDIMAAVRNLDGLKEKTEKIKNKIKIKSEKLEKLKNENERDSLFDN